MICALSGGVDSTVAATLVHKVLGVRLHCVFVDNGLLRYKVRWCCAWAPAGPCLSQEHCLNQWSGTWHVAGACHCPMLVTQLHIMPARWRSCGTPQLPEGAGYSLPTVRP